MNIFLNVNSPADLEAYLDILERRKLLNAVAVAPASKPAPVAKGAVRGNGGEWFRENAIRQAAFLEEMGVDKRPPATEAEMALRAKIDKAREKASEKGVNWKVDVITRHKVLLDYGYDIFGQDGTQPAVAEPDEPLPAIDLDNVVA